MGEFSDLLKCSAGEMRELFLQEKSGFSVTVRNGEKSDDENISSFGASFRIIRKGQMGFASTNEKANLKELYEEAMKNLFPINDWGWDIPSSSFKNSYACDIYDEKTACLGSEGLWDILFEAEKKAKAADGRIKKTLEASFSAGSSKITLANSEGLLRKARKSFASFHIELIASSGTSEEVAAGGGYNTACYFNDLKIGEIIDEAVEDTVSQIEAETLPSSKITALLPPLTACEILVIVSPWFCADNFLEKRIPPGWTEGEKVCSEDVSVYDDGTMPRAAGSFPFDGEGVGTSRHTVIKNGVFENYLSDGRTAKLLGRKTTGNASRNAFTLPRVGLFNLHIGEGRGDKNDFLKNGEVFRIDEIIGAHLVSVENAQFSVGARGRFYRNGKFIKPVRGVTVSGSILSFLKDIKGVGSDLKFYGSVGSPSLLVKNVYVAGS